MKRQRGMAVSRILGAALAVTLMTGSIAAQARDHDRDHDRQSRVEQRHGHDRHARNDDSQRHQRHARNRDHDRYAHNHDNDRQWRREHARQQHWSHDRSRAYARGYQHGRFDAGRYYRPAGYRHYVWYRGARLPAAYYAPRYIVHDYGHYHLHRPPHGHHWVRVDHDVVLTAIATGAVVAVVNGLFY
jgi:Ni/Co efflux regulator RcnB